ncbi:hypothetical protein [uncultured Parabacteroides sp.]|uniref:hypothetical protein n=1 Tax=uncultured Parabacteroides sp. TaxID=512312 RepID=UPI00262BEED7|nr:hypothetical protein [uncultured Parabacteroides sp.]
MNKRKNNRLGKAGITFYAYATERIRNRHHAIQRGQAAVLVAVGPEDDVVFAFTDKPCNLFFACSACHL